MKEGEKSEDKGRNQPNRKSKEKMKETLKMLERETEQTNLVWQTVKTKKKQNI